jgi:hypothetical protein
VKHFVKALDHTTDALQHTGSMFCQIFEAEMKSEIFTGTQIRQALQYQELEAE